MKHFVGINTKHVATCTEISAQPCKLPAAAASFFVACLLGNRFLIANCLCVGMVASGQLHWDSRVRTVAEGRSVDMVGVRR